MFYPAIINLDIDTIIVTLYTTQDLTLSDQKYVFMCIIS